MKLFLISILTPTISVGIICLIYFAMFQSFPNAMTFWFILLANLVSYIEAGVTQYLKRDLLEEHCDDL